MFKFATSTPAEQNPAARIAAIALLLGILPVIAASTQPKEVTATIFSGYLAIMATGAAVIAKRKGKRALAIIAVSTSIVFSGLFATYAYIAFGR